jgi:hypothetical protein
MFLNFAEEDYIVVQVVWLLTKAFVGIWFVTPSAPQLRTSRTTTDINQADKATPMAWSPGRYLAILLTTAALCITAK